MNELKATQQKSFYGKANTRTTTDGAIILTSYTTDVAKIVNGKLVRLWDDWSATTQRHINAFCELYSLPTINKKQWDKMPVDA